MSRYGRHYRKFFNIQFPTGCIIIMLSGLYTVRHATRHSALLPSNRSHANFKRTAFDLILNVVNTNANLFFIRTKSLKECHHTVDIIENFSTYNFHPATLLLCFPSCTQYANATKPSVIVDGAEKD